MRELAVSFPQQRLWLLDRVEPGSPAYNVARAFRLRGEIDGLALAAALRHLVRRHDALRTTFSERDGVPLQVVHDSMDVALWQEDLQQLPEDVREQSAIERAAEEARRPFDLSHGPLVRTLLLHIAPDHHVFVLTMHHIVTDGWSMGLLFSDLAALYDAELTGRPAALKPLPVSYADFAAWQREFHDAEAMRASVEYWRQALAGAPELLELPTDRPRPATQGHAGHTVRFTIPEVLAERLKAFAESQGATLYMALLALWQVLLARYSGADEVVVGSPLAGRTEVELEGVVGFFVNTVALRTSVADDPSVDQLLARVRATCLDAWSHQQVPFERVVKVLAPDRGLSHSPIVQVMFILQNLPKQHLRIGPAAAAADELDFDNGVAKADVTLEIVEGAGLQCSLEYRCELFDEPRMLRMAQHFERLVASAVANPAARVSELDLLTDGERDAIASWNFTGSEYPRDVSLAGLFHAQAARTPFRTALVGPDREVTYARLRAEAVALGGRLTTLGVRPGDRVAVCLERSVDAVAAILGVLDAGGVVVPIDPSYPAPRIAFMLVDSRAAAVISRGAPTDLAAGIPVLDPSEVVVSESPRAGEGACSPGGDVPAYVIYTSGSTGTPKGVIGTHRGAVNRLHWMWRAYPFDESDVCVHKTALSFVDSIAEIFGGLLQGVPTVVLGDEAGRDAVRLAQAIEGHRITRLVLVPSLLHALLEHVDDVATRLRTLRICVTSGEELPLALFQRVSAALPHVRVLNVYGSSEVAADVTCFDAHHDAAGPAVPIGRPIDNTRIYILDRHLRMVPIGVPGEICVAGDGVALGYHERPDLTGARFVADSFAPPGTRMFRTGDLGCFRADGQIDYLGRIDHQVKLRGMRVELGEIEATLEHHPSVKQAVVVLDAHSGEPRLVAYAVPRPEVVLVPATLRRFLRQHLPEHMVPAVFVALDALPLMPNGKIDRKRLPAPGAEASTGVPYVAPRTDIEVTIADIWSQVLHVGRVGAHERFFDLGGHSLLAMQVLARIRHAFDVDVSLRALFDEPTVAGLAAAVEEARTGGQRARTPRIVPRRSKPNRAALLAQLESMSDEDVDALLEAALARRGDAAGA